VAGYDSDPTSRKLLQDLALNCDTHPPYSLINGIIHVGDRIWVGETRPSS